MQQPSAQGIASLYTGNPVALQQRIQQEQKAKPGMPPDLQKMLALQIVTNVDDAFEKQKAMDQLQQMSGPQGEPPTVLETLQQQAAQKMQAAPQAQPQAQAAGIDQLPAEFEMAGGGIVAFNGEDRSDVPKYRTRYDAMNDENREREEAERAEREERVRENNGSTMPYGEQMSRLGSSLSGGIANALKTLVSAPGYGLSRDEAPAPATAAGAGRGIVNPPAADASAPAPVAPPRAPVRDLQQLATQKAAPAATPAVAPAGSTQAAYDDYLKRTLTAKRDDERAAEEGRFERAVGRADTTQIDRLMDEMEKRKQALAPKQGYAGLMEYLGEISRSGSRGRGSFAAGAAGAARLDDLNKERATQQFELTKQGVELAQKKLDMDRSFKLDKYKTGQEGAKRIDDAAKEAAKEFGLDARNEKTLANQIKVQLLQNQGMLATANVRAANAGGGDKQQLSELKALQKTLTDQMKTTFNKGERQQLQAKLGQVEAAIAQMAGLDTMGSAPGAAGPGGTSTSGWGKAQVVK
jgi:hypothetical protein